MYEISRNMSNSKFILAIVIEQLLQCGIFPSTSTIACALLAHPETQASGLDILKQAKNYIHVAEVLLNKGDIPQGKINILKVFLTIFHHFSAQISSCRAELRQLQKSKILGRRSETR